MSPHSPSLSTLLENLKAGKLHDFHGGIHPPGRKTPANLSAISDAGIPEELILQVRQHIGQAAHITVKVGERVLKGQALTEPLSPMMVPVHAPTSGIISAIEDRPLCHPSGLSGLCIVLKSDGLDEWRARFPVADYTLLEPQVLISRIHQAGIAGLGGAAFPTNVKLAASQVNDDSAVHIETLIINGVECEPYISADDRLMREHAHEILQGIEILRHIVKPKLIILAVEDNKPEALAALKAAQQAMQAAAQSSAELAPELSPEQQAELLIIAVPTKYPSGGQKQLIEVLTGMQVPQKSLSSDVGILMQNVGTVFAIQQAIITDEPLIRRVVTLAGEAFAQPGNVWAPIGTPVRYLLKRHGLSAERDQRIIIGGPMMGFTLHSAAAPIVKGSNCILAPRAAELAPPGDEMACIRCSKCADACPVSLLPQQLYWYARNDEHEKLESHNLFDCIECGACAYVCPSSIPLVQYYRIAKADIRHTRQEAEQAERAKDRFEARQARLALEKEERQARQAKAAAERKARMAEQAAKTGEDPVAAALARVKARQQEDTPALTAEEMAAARTARKEEAKRNRALKAAQATEPDNIEADAGTPPASGKNPAVLAALARAKARKAAAESDPNADINADTRAAESATPAKNPAVAAAIAKAKAAQAAASKRDSIAPRSEKIDHKKEAIKAAVARAKARQQAELEAAMAAVKTDDSPAVVTNSQTRATEQPAASPSAHTKNTAPAAEGDAKKSAIQAAVARAKARKLAQAAETEPATKQASSATEVDTEVDAETAASSPAAAAVKEQPETASAADAKKAAIQAAVARAKARKLAQAAESEQDTQAPNSTPVADSTADSATGSETKSVSSEPAETLSPADAKKAAIQAAVARAKARKLAQAAADIQQASAKPEAQPEIRTEPETSAEPGPTDAATKKQAAIKAAVARAKARKAALAQTAETSHTPPSDKEEQS